MGRILSLQEHQAVLAWGEQFKAIGKFSVYRPAGRSLREGASRELKLYWNLAMLSRADNRRPELAKKARRVVFRVRTILERSLARRLTEALNQGEITIGDLFDGSFFGCSIKQGVSLRVPLTSCVPSTDCHGTCYAHDGMDAGHNPVVKGVLNGVIATRYESGEASDRQTLRANLRKHVVHAVAAARREAKGAGFQREPRIRFSHVGEIAAFPNFANDLAKMVFDESNGAVACVVYTRHPDARLLDSELFVINFTLDRSSLDRSAWAPVGSRLTYSAWAGETSTAVAVNFIEHHRFGHIVPSGTGPVCPATAPDTAVRTCDAVKCTLCFGKARLGDA